MGMPIYFSGSISGGRSDVALYARIADALTQHGFVVYRGEVTNASVSGLGEALSPQEIYRRDVDAIADIAARGGALVAEVTQPSHGVGYEIAIAAHRYDMPVVCLWRRTEGRRCSAMLTGNPRLRVLEYDESSFDATVAEVGAILRAARE